MVGFDSVVLYVILGALVGIIWSLRRIYVLENKIVALDEKTEKLLAHVNKKK